MQCQPPLIKESKDEAGGADEMLSPGTEMRAAGIMAALAFGGTQDFSRMC